MGLQIDEVKLGTGKEAKAGTRVTVHYVGTLTNLSTGADNGARRTGDKEASSATEARTGQNRAAADRKRGKNSENQPHTHYPRRQNYPPQPLTVGESRSGV